MAKKLDHFPERSHLGRPRGSKYDKWLDGSVWQLTSDLDFHGSASNFVRGIRQHANVRRGLGLRALVEDSNGVETITVQAVDKRARK
jgi:hypothetical protein